MLLAISTATEALSVAWWDDEGRLGGEFHEVIGRGHAERLLPTIADLLGDRRATRIAVDVGPGSFTGVRVGVAAARGLGIGWGARVSGFSGAALLAAAAVDGRIDGPVAVAIRAGHGEVFWQMFSGPPPPQTGLTSLGPPRSLPPAVAAAEARGASIVGTGADLVSPGTEPAWPRAADWPLLPCELNDLPPRPLYVRAPDAKPAAKPAVRPAA